MKRLLLIVALSAIINATAQPNINITGQVYDAQTGEKLINADIIVPELHLHTATNEYGHFAFRMPKGKKITLTASYVGYESKTINLQSAKDTRIKIDLIPNNNLYVKISVKKQSAVTRPEISTLQLSPKQIKQLPLLGGEADLMKALQLLPGISSGKEGSSDLFVRGGSPDENLIILDDVPLYYVNHLGGFVSVFDIDAVNSVKLIKGGFPAKYGNRLSSVVDIRLKDGNRSKRSGNISLGLPGAKLSLNGPLGDKTTFMFSGRRSFYDLFMVPVSYIGTEQSFAFGYYFYDITTKISYRPNENNKIGISLYGGDDIFFIRSFKQPQTGSNENAVYKKKWGNRMLAIHWHSTPTPVTETNTVLSYTQYRFLLDLQVYSDQFRDGNTFRSNIRDFSLKSMATWYASNLYRMDFGGQISYDYFIPAVAHHRQERQGVQSINSLQKSYTRKSINTAVYIENKIRLYKKLKFNLGFRLHLMHIGKQSFLSPEPRLTFTFKPAPFSRIQGGFSVMQQNIHLLSTRGLGIPVDLWMPATRLSPPERSLEYVLGYTKQTPGNKWSISVEAYYKLINHLITYKPGASFSYISKHWEDKVLVNGQGKSYGLEILLQKRAGKHTGWLSYTLSKTDRKFQAINNGNPFPFKYDRRHNLILTYHYQINPHISFSAVWQYGTGYPFTMKTAKFTALDNRFFEPFNDNQNGMFEYVEAYKYSSPNAFRMRDFHRLDVSINFEKQKKYGQRIWNITIINVYNRMNPYFYYTEEEDTPQGEKTVIKQLTLFPFFPSLTYSYKF